MLILCTPEVKGNNIFRPDPVGFSVSFGVGIRRDTPFSAQYLLNMSTEPILSMQGYMTGTCLKTDQGLVCRTYFKHHLPRGTSVVCKNSFHSLMISYIHAQTTKTIKLFLF